MNNKQTRTRKTARLQSLMSEISPAEQAKVDNKMLIASRIDAILESRHMSRVAFAGLLNKQPSEITKWLSGTQNFTVDTLTEIALTLEVSIEDLVVARKTSNRTVYNVSVDATYTESCIRNLTKLDFDILPVGTLRGTIPSDRDTRFSNTTRQTVHGEY